MCACVGTFQLGHLHLFDLLQLLVALSVLVQQPAVVLALDLVLVLQLVVLLLQVVVLVLMDDKDCSCSSSRRFFWVFYCFTSHTVLL